MNLTIMIMQVEQGAPELAVITALDITEQVQIKKRLEAVQREQSELVGELSAANKRFGAHEQRVAGRQRGAASCKRRVDAHSGRVTGDQRRV